MPQGQPLTVPDDGLTTRARRNAQNVVVVAHRPNSAAADRLAADAAGKTGACSYDRRHQN